MALITLKPPLIHVSICNNYNRIRPLNARNAGLLRLGTAPDISRIAIQFDLTSIPFLATIKAAKLVIFIMRKKIPHTVGPIGIFPVFSKFDQKAITWSKQPVTAAMPEDRIDSITSDTALLTFNITGLAQQWSLNHATNFGVIIKFLEESYCGLLEVAGKNYPDSRFWPYLELDISAPFSNDERSMVRAVALDQSVVVTTQDSVQATSPLNILLYEYSYLVVNSGTNPATAYLQVSPNNTNWQTQSDIKTVNPNTLVSFIPNIIAKYARLCYQSQTTSQSTSLTIYTQGVSYS